MTKYKQKKTNYQGVEFDSRTELKAFKELDIYYSKNQITKAGRCGSMLLFEIKVTKSNIKSELSKNSISYKPDFRFFTLTQFFDCPPNKKVFCEVKSKATAKARDYSLRKKLFLQKCVENDWVFMEWIYPGKPVFYNI